MAAPAGMAAAAAVASIVGSAIVLGKVIVAPIKRQFNYLCCFTSNIQSLKDESEKLNDARVGLQLRVGTAENNAEVILREVERWFTRANENQIITSEIEAKIPNVKKDFLSMKLRFLLSRKAKKTTEATKKLLGECNFNPISQPAGPLATGPIQIGETYEFETRKKIEEDIMEDLRGGEVNMLGICGMGGVGKTTMAQRIMKRARVEDLFDEILMVVVSQPVDMSKIQREISDSLGLELKEEALQARAHKLRARLMGTKRTLMVLDDVWKRLELEKLGIPCESGDKGCTVLLTSRNMDVFNAMNIQKVRALEILSETEAGFLFKENVGTCVDDQHLTSIAEEVVKECKGLPVALVTVGRALKDKKTKSSWEDALQQLKSCNPIDMPDVLLDVYNPIKVSYDFLDNRRARSVFLLCSLFPEDCNVRLELLTWYIMGLGILEGIRNLGEARNRVCSLVELLKSRFLLLDGDDEHSVKLHDVVRDVAIFIASQERLVDSNFSSIDWWLEHSYSDCKWTSVFPIERIQLPVVLEVPNLLLLLIHSQDWIRIQMHDQFFEVMKKLNVLSLTSTSFKPEALQLLKNLKALNLEQCTLESVSVVGQLLNLQILRCHSCDSITELPAEIGRLIHLRLLDFSYCESLNRIAPGVISSLVRLEELKMIGSFKGWEAEKNGKERRNASLNELQSLSNLTCLEIEIGDCTLAAEDIHLSSKIVKYEITFREIHFRETFEKGMYLELPREISLGDWIHIFLRSTEYLELKGDGSNSLDLAQVQNIKTFHFSRCSTVKKLVSTKSIDWRFGVFPDLECLVLENLPNLEEICDGPIQAGSNSFNNLKELKISRLPGLLYLWNSQNQNVSLSNLTSIDIEGCDKLRNLFPLNIAKDGLLQLKELEIWECEMMEEVFSNDGDGHITFPKLKKLSLEQLPSLTTFCKGIESIECPLLTEMNITHCPKLTSLAGHYDDSLHFFCNQKVTFGSLCCHHIPPAGFFSKLEKLYICLCGSIRSLFPSSMARNLVNLKTLKIWNCNEMVKVIGDDEENVCENSQLMFPSLEELSLSSLPNLVNFCGWRCTLQLPSLTDIDIFDCPRMESFTMGSLTTPKLSLVGFATSSGNNPSDDSFHLFCNQKVTFGSLKKLRIVGYENISNLWCHQIPSAGFFNKLEELSISRCGNIRCLFSSSIAANLVNLKGLKIESCNEMVKVIGDDEENVCDNSQLMFPSLEELSLGYLDNLVNFCGWRRALQLPSLTDIEIYDCPRMESFTMGSLTTPKLSLVGFATCSGNNPSVAGHSDDSFHLFCNQKVTFGSLKKLRIVGYENFSNLWCHQIPPAGFFNKLEELSISRCGNIRCLFSSSIAANLVNLKGLKIESCNEMVKVIGDDEENVSENSQLMFPSLEELSLGYLDNLVNFCGWRCALQLPSLSYISIYDCTRMENFSMGSLTTPNLQSIEIDSERKEVEDLNGAVQLYFRAEERDQESSQIETEEDSDEEENEWDEEEDSNEDEEELDEHVQEVWDEEKQQRDQESAQIEKEQEESNKEDQEDGEHENVKTEEEEMKQAAEENYSSN